MKQLLITSILLNFAALIWMAIWLETGASAPAPNACMTQLDVAKQSASAPVPANALNEIHKQAVQYLGLISDFDLNLILSERKRNLRAGYFLIHGWPNGFDDSWIDDDSLYEADGRTPKPQYRALTATKQRNSTAERPP